MENIGALAILLAFCFAVYAVVASLAGKWANRPFLVLSAERAVYSIWVLLTTAAGLLIYALIFITILLFPKGIVIGCGTRRISRAATTDRLAASSPAMDDPP